MKHSDLVSIFTKIKKNLVQSAVEVQREPNIEAVHSFRLKYKKFRSILCLVSNRRAGREALKISNNLKSMYRLIGELRDLQLLRDKLCSENIGGVLDEYIRSIDQRILGKEELIQKIDIKQAVSKSTLKFDHRLPHAFSLIDIELYRDDQWALIKRAIINMDGTDDGIHSVRKALKNIYFVTLLLHAAGQPLYQTDDWQGKEEGYFIQLMKELGDYNDLSNAIILLNQDVIVPLPANDRDFLGPLLANWKHQRLKQRVRVVTKLRKRVFPELDPTEFR